MINTQLEIIDTPDGRFYVTPTGILPSVSTILSTTSDRSSIESWRRSIGADEADRIMMASASIGTDVHSVMESLVLGRDHPMNMRSVRERLILSMVSGISEAMVGHLGEVFGCETRLYYDGLYAGTADLIANWDGEPCIIDYKTMRNGFKDDALSKFFMQTCAYALAYNNMFDTDIRSCVIIECDHERRVRSTHLSRRDFGVYRGLWIDALEAYYDNRIKEPV